MECVLRKDLLRVGQLEGGLGGGVGGGDVVNEQHPHDSVGDFLVKDLHRLEHVHTSVRRREALVRDNGRCRCRGSDVDGDSAPLLASQHGAPLLEALRHRVVGTLGDDEGIHQVKLLTLVALDRLERVGHELSHGPEHGLQQALPHGRLLQVVPRSPVGPLRDQIAVGGRAQVGQPHVLGAVSLNEGLHDHVASEVDAHVQLAIQVRVPPDGDGLALAHDRHRVRHPRRDLGGLGH
mmetsp:Transcript_22172/g.51485  ORF Transcript_22172/g.51485 Transcript_22172/m.51485 type:complete len:236 (-) Transcript_22172:1481-2188(-)